MFWCSFGKGDRSRGLDWFARLCLLFGEVLASVRLKVVVVDVFLQRVGQTGRGVLDLWDLELGDVFVLSGDAEVLDDLVCLLCEGFVDSNGMLGVWFGEFEVVACAMACQKSEANLKHMGNRLSIFMTASFMAVNRSSRSLVSRRNAISEMSFSGSFSRGCTGSVCGFGAEQGTNVAFDQNSDLVLNCFCLS